LYAAESVGQKLWRRDAVRNAGVFDLALRAYQTLLHSWLGDQERASDLARRESADGAKRKCDSRFHRQRRMATREDQPEALIGDLLRVVSQPLECVQFGSLLSFDGSDTFASQAIDRFVASGENNPSCRVVRNAPCRPGMQSLHECVLDRLFSQVEAAGRSDQGRDRPSRLAAEQEVEIFTSIGRWYQPCG
jgi:hypothetical protein